MRQTSAETFDSVADWGAVMIVGAALLTAPWHGHVDDIDAPLYQVVVRHVVEGAGWFDLRFLPGLFDHFREHLPFAFWPAAAAQIAFGEGALGPLAAIWSLGTLAIVGWAGAQLGDRWTGLTAVLALALTESFWRYGGRMLLDPPLVFFATAASIPLLLPRVRWWGWTLAALLAALAVLTKGPFGLLPLPCAAVAAAVVYREPRRLLWGAEASAVAVVPLAAFLWIDRTRGSGSWWEGYLHAQLLASATGARTDGRMMWWYPLQVVVGRFWPGLPLALLGAWHGLFGREDPEEAGRTPTSRQTALLFSLLSLLLLAGLCIPARKQWNHELLAFPALALLAGVGASPLLRRWVSANAWRRKLISRALVAAAVLLSVASLAGLGRRVLLPPCVVSTEFAAGLRDVPAGTPVLVVAPSMDRRMIVNLAAERRLVPWPLARLPASPSSPTAGAEAARLALVREGVPLTAPWSELGAARGWTLAARP